MGTTRRIDFVAWEIDVASIYFSADGGSSWDVLSDSVHSLEPDWMSYPWVVPNTPSSQCLVRVRDYIGMPQDQPDSVFEIRSVTDADADSMDDDWESATFGDLERDGSGDADGDGRTDADEFLYGYDPLNADW